MRRSQIREVIGVMIAKMNKLIDEVAHGLRDWYQICCAIAPLSFG